MLSLIGNCLLDVVAGIAAAALAATVAWHVFKLVRLPELGPWIVLAALFAIPGAARRSFVQMVILFLAIDVIALLGEGKTWRERDRVRRILRRISTRRNEPRPSPF